MRISDWSSDVCSSDLQYHVPLLLSGRAIGISLPAAGPADPPTARPSRGLPILCVRDRGPSPVEPDDPRCVAQWDRPYGSPLRHRSALCHLPEGRQRASALDYGNRWSPSNNRSNRLRCFIRPDPRKKCRTEEHTSELKSLMHTSYDVF